MLAFCGVPQISSDLELDTTNSHLPKNLACVTDRALFRSFSNCKVSAVDISDYEGAEIVLDLCSDVPADLHNRFDFIIDAGSLDNIFDPIRALMSMTRMLKPGGRMYIFAWGNSHPTAYLKFSPDWFTDYFAVNEFEDCQTYVALYPSGTTSPKGWEETFASLAGNHDMGVWRYNAYVHGGGGRGYECSSIDSERPFQNFLIAEKEPNRLPIAQPFKSIIADQIPSPTLLQRSVLQSHEGRNFGAREAKQTLENKSLGTFGTMSEVAHWTVSQPLSMVSQPPSMAQKLRNLIFKTSDDHRGQC